MTTPPRSNGAPVVPHARDFAADWAEAVCSVPASLRERVSRSVATHAPTLADNFYASLMADPTAHGLLDHDLVNKRLRQSMQLWLIQLFDPEATADEVAATQAKAGDMHARVGVPMRLVSKAGRSLRRAIVDLVARDVPDSAQALLAAQLVHELVVLAIDEMNSAFATGSSRLARADEAYRLMFIGQDMKTERERRRSELLEWANQLLQAHFWSPDSRPVSQGGSQFLLWLHHKASILFQGAPEIDAIRSEISHLESQLLPQLSAVRDDHSAARSVAAEIDQRIGQVKNLLGSLFDQFVAPQDGRDATTSLLSRRYFPAIAKREIDSSSARGVRFAIFMIDIDGFRALSARWGHTAPAVLLSQVALLLQENLRAGDFIFRVGDDEFLILLVEADEASAMGVAQGLRSRIEGYPFLVAGDSVVHLTVSIGVAVWDGHPDYQQLLDRADQALVVAQSQGKNRCTLAASDGSTA